MSAYPRYHGGNMKTSIEPAQATAGLDGDTPACDPVAMILEERRRIGQEIHDTIAQDLAAAGMQIRVLERRLRERSAPEAAELAQVSGCITALLAQLRHHARGLLPVELASAELVSALTALCECSVRRSGVTCSLDASGWDGIACPERTATNLYGIAREAVANALRHGAPSRIFVRLSSGRNHGRLTITDNGCGIPEPPVPSAGMGLRIMGQRAKEIAGTLLIGGHIGRGTRVTCTFPLGGYGEQHMTAALPA
jgi:two-component system sensor kinase FixL